MPKKSKEPTLHIRGIPADLLGRVNARAELLGQDRDEMVIAWLRDHSRDLEKVQRELKEKNHTKS